MAVPKGFLKKLSRLFRSGPRARLGKNATRGQDGSTSGVRQGAISVVQKSQSPSFANMTGNAYNLSERLMRYQDFCLAGDTLVYTLDGAVTLKHLAETKGEGERFFVVSYDYEKKSPTVGVAFLPRVAGDGSPQKRVRVELDDGHVDCTPDHRFILRDGSTREARDLKSGDSLMPLYVMSEADGGYNVIYTLDHADDDTQKHWRREHIFVAESLWGDINHDTHCVHHIDFNKKNNHPSNLRVMTHGDHSSLHAQLNNVNKFGIPNAAHSAWMRENGNRRVELTFKAIVDAVLMTDGSASAVSKLLEADVNMIKLRLKERGFKNWLDFSQRFAEAQSDATHDAIVHESRTPSIEEILAQVESSTSLDELASKLGCTRNAVNRRLQSHGVVGGWTEIKTGYAYVGGKRGPSYTGPAYQDVCSAFRPGMTQQQLADACSSTKNKIGTCLRNAGFSSYSKWAVEIKNHKVVSVSQIADDVVYTITVEKYHNLAVGSLSVKNNGRRMQSMVFVANCEMEYTPELASALDIYADEAVASDEKEQVFHVFAPNEAIKVALEDLFFNVMNVEFNLRGWVRNLCKYGDFFLMNEVHPEHGVIRVMPLPVNEIEREDGYDPSDPSLYRFRWVTLGNRALDCWEVTHMRLLGNDQFLPYGMSVVEAARRIWRQLILIEDAMLTYRIVRAPERRVFYVDVGNTPPEEVPLVVEEAKRNVRSAPAVDRATGRADLRYNPVSIEEDYWVPVRGTETGTKIETLQGGQNAAAVEDVQYIQRKLFAAVKIPKAYLGYDETLCLGKDERVQLLDGRKPTMQQLAEMKLRGELDDVWVWSVDERGRPVPGRVIDAWKTKDVTAVTRVTLDNGKSIDCTPNHPFMCRDGSYRRADELQPGQSLMPLYRKLSDKRDGDFQSGYEKILCNESSQWKFAHRVVASATDVDSHSSVADEGSYVIHHADHDKLNNSPLNLLKMGKRAHALYHSAVGDNLLSEASRDKLRAVMKTSAYAEKQRAGVQRAWDLDNGSRRKSVVANNSKHKRTSVTIDQLLVILKQSRSITEFFVRAEDTLHLTRTGVNAVARRAGLDCGAWLRENVSAPPGASLEEIADYCRRKNVTSAQHFRREPLPADCPVNAKQLKELIALDGHKRFSSFAKKYLHCNHKVVSVETVTLEASEPVYDITVDVWHNFGVISSRDTNDAMPNLLIVSNSSKATLAQEDIRFSRTITVIQKTVIAELQRLAVMHLYCLGFPEEELQDFVIKLSNPSTVAQQQKLELLRARAEIAGSFPEGAVDMTWLRREVLGFTEEHIAEIDENRLRERKINAQIDAAGEPGEEGGGGGGGSSLFGGDSGGGGGGGDSPLDAAAGADGGAPPDDAGDAEEPAGDEPDAGLDAGDDQDDELDEPDVSLLTSGEDPEQLAKAKRRSSRKRRHGSAALSSPDMSSMVQRSVTDDPFDSHWLKTAGKNPLAEVAPRPRRGLSPDMVAALRRLPRSAAQLL